VFVRGGVKNNLRLVFLEELIDETAIRDAPDNKLAWYRVSGA
jgi:hypothetical protein